MTVESHENLWVLRATCFVLAGYGLGFVMAGVRLVLRLDERLHGDVIVLTRSVGLPDVVSDLPTAAMAGGK